jgi:hypothetical protein
MSAKELFTKERMVYGIIIALIPVIGGYFTARVGASTETAEQLDDFRLEMTREVGDMKGDVQTLKALNPVLEKRLDSMDRKLESMDGSLQSLTSKLLNENK